MGSQDGKNIELLYKHFREEQAASSVEDVSVKIASIPFDFGNELKDLPVMTTFKGSSSEDLV